MSDLTWVSVVLGLTVLGLIYARLLGNGDWEPKS